MKKKIDLVKFAVMMITIVSVLASNSLDVEAGWCIFGHSYGDNIYYHEYEAYNDVLHTKVLKAYRLCNNCGHRTEVNGSGRIQEAHIDGDSNHTCDICNLKCGELYDESGNHLNHIASVLREKASEYQKLDNGRHYKITYSNEGLCSCGKVMVESVASKTVQNHSYSHSSDTSCNQCGSHRHIESICGLTGVNEYTEITDDGHTLKVSDGGGFCTCGEMVRDEKYTLKTENHVYKEGICKCGHEQVEKINIFEEPLSINDTEIIEHKHSYDSSSDTECDCGYHRHLPLASPPVGATRYETYDDDYHYKISADGGSMCSCGQLLEETSEIKVVEAHEYAGDICIDCGEQRPVERQVEEHEHNCELEGHSYDDLAYQYTYAEYYDDNFHTVFIHSELECDCGKSLISDDDYLQGHHLVKGTCTECNEHVHEEAYTWPYEDWKVLEEIDWDSHKVYRKDGIYCYCHELIGLGEMYSEVEDHSFVNGVCECGYAKNQNSDLGGQFWVIASTGANTIKDKVGETVEFFGGGALYLGEVVTDGERYVQIFELGGIIGEEIVDNGWLVDKDGLDLTSELIHDVGENVIISIADSYDEFKAEDYESWMSGDINKILSHYTGTFTGILYEAGEIDLGLKALKANQLLKLSKTNKVLKHLDDVGDITKLSKSKIDEIVSAVIKKDIPFEDILEFRRNMSNVDFDDDIVKYFDDSIKKNALPNLSEVDTGLKKMVETAEAAMDGDHYRKVNGVTGLQPDIEYHIGDYLYKTDAEGRIDNVKGILTLDDAKRNEYAQLVAGRADRLPDDHGGHLIASIFNGSGDLDNLVAMNGKLNQNGWRNMEREWANALADGMEVEVHIVNCYEASSLRPSDFVVGYKIDGQQFYEVFKNQAGG